MVSENENEVRIEAYLHDDIAGAITRKLELRLERGDIVLLRTYYFGASGSGMHDAYQMMINYAARDGLVIIGTCRVPYSGNVILSR